VSRLCQTRPVPPRSRLGRPEPIARLIEEKTGSTWMTSPQTRSPSPTRTTVGPSEGKG